MTQAQLQFYVGESRLKTLESQGVLPCLARDSFHQRQTMMCYCCVSILASNGNFFYGENNVLFSSLRASQTAWCQHWKVLLVLVACGYSVILAGVVTVTSTNRWLSRMAVLFQGRAQLKIILGALLLRYHGTTTPRTRTPRIIGNASANSAAEQRM